jgi:hypothetical protein
LHIDPVVLPVRADEPDIDDAIRIIDPHHDAIVQDFAWARKIVATTTLVILSHYANIFAAKFLSMMGSFAVNFSMAPFVIFRPLPATNEI